MYSLIPMEKNTRIIILIIYFDDFIHELQIHAPREFRLTKRNAMRVVLPGQCLAYIPSAQTAITQ